MRRTVALAIAALALVAIGFFLAEAGRILGIGGAPAPGTPGMATPGAAGGALPAPGAGTSGYPGEPGGENAVPVEVAPAVVRGIRERVRGSGILEPAREVTIVARAEGEVEELLVEEGERVEADSELCVIDEEPLRIAESIARIERDQAKRNLERLTELVASRSVTSQELEDARAAFDRASAQAEKAALDLSHARPRAPFAGIVIDRAIEKGRSVRSGDALFTIADFEPLRLRVHLPESDIPAVVVGQGAELRFDRDGEVLVRGSVERISPVVDRESLTVEVVVRFDFAAGQVRPGSFAHVDIITRTESDVVLVPREAVQREAGETVVYRIFDGRAHRTPVITGYEDESVIQVREGLVPGDLVVTEGTRELRDGQRVQVYRESPVPLEPLETPRPGGGGG